MSGGDAKAIRDSVPHAEIALIRFTWCAWASARSTRSDATSETPTTARTPQRGRWIKNTRWSLLKAPDKQTIGQLALLGEVQHATVRLDQPPDVVLADGGYWNVPQIDAVVMLGSQVIVNPDSSARASRSADQRKLRDKRVHGLYAHMQRVISSELGAALYRRRQQMIEPIFAQTKVTRRADRFQRRGLAACQYKWRLVAASHNLLKLYRHAPAAR